MNQSSDTAFKGLLLSVILHALIVAYFLVHEAPAITPPQAPTEVTFIESGKSRKFVTETDDKKEVFDRLKDQADYLSKLTKRVKKEMKARNNGPTRNSMAEPDLMPKLRPHQGVAGMAQARREEGEGLAAPGGSPMRRVAIGPSSLAEYIPGVQEGAFTALNSDQFTYYAFFARINEQVRNRWVALVRAYMNNLTQQDLAALAKTERHTVVEIILSASGDFIRAVLHTSSGEQALDQTASDAFRLAAPFLNPPKEMVEEDGKIHLKYGFVVQFRPSFGPGSN
ncbi:MAG: energy transducer TonB [Bdellovibrionales bacterium]